MAVPKGRNERRLSSRDQAKVQVAAIMGRTKIGLALIRWAGIVLLGLMGYKCVAVLAGHTTAAEFVVKFIGSLGMSRWLAWLIALVGCGYGVGQRRLRLRAVG